MDEAATRRIVETYVAAWRAGDLPLVIGSYHDDIVLHWYGQNPLAGDHVGKPAALQALAAMAARVRRAIVAVDGLMADGDRALLMVRERFERDGRVAELSRLLLFRLADGLLRECWVYDADQRLADSFLA